MPIVAIGGLIVAVLGALGAFGIQAWATWTLFRVTPAIEQAATVAAPGVGEGIGNLARGVGGTAQGVGGAAQGIGGAAGGLGDALAGDGKYLLIAGAAALYLLVGSR